MGGQNGGNVEHGLRVHDARQVLVTIHKLGDHALDVLLIAQPVSARPMASLKFAEEEII